MSDPTPNRHDRPTVRPRWVWGGLVVALLGAAGVGLGIAVLSWAWVAAGTTLLLAGVLASLRGGVRHDAIPGFALRRELRQVREGDVHQGVAPSDAHTGGRARRDATATNLATRGLQEAASHPARLAWAPVAGWTLVLLAVALITLQGMLVAHTPTGRDNSVRDTGLAILVGLAGLGLASATGRQRLAVGIALLAGVGLVLGGLLAAHGRTDLAVVEVAAGCLAVLCGLTAWVSPVTRPRDPGR